jgi:hypothetical protein
MRRVDATLAELKRQLEGRDRSVCSQGNRVVLHLVFRELDLQRIDDSEYDWSLELKQVPSLTQRALEGLISSVEAIHPNSYLTSLFKNRTKCRDLVHRVRAGQEDTNGAQPI